MVSAPPPAAPPRGLIWSPEQDPEGRTAAFDPYSAWSLLYARRFDFAALEHKADPSDFTYQITVENLISTEVEPLAAPEPPSGALGIVSCAAQLGAFSGSTQVTLHPDNADFDTLCIGSSDTKAETTVPDSPEQETQTSRQTVRFRAPLRTSSLATSRTERPVQRQGLTRQTATIVGVIDDGINLIHDRFARLSEGVWDSRIDFGWIMDGLAQPDSTVPFGREYTHAQLSAVVADRTRSDEARMRDLGLIDFTRPGHRTVAQTLAHGTHTLDLAAGYPPQDAPRDARIIAVQLPALVTLETSGAWLAPFAIAAASYILDRAYAMSLAEGFAIPVVLNFSYSIAASAHNGQHFAERGLDVLLSAHRTRMLNAFPKQPERCEAELVIPAGNRALERGHAEVKAQGPDTDLTLTLPWRLQPGDSSANFLEVWLPVTARRLRVSIAPPAGAALPLRGLSMTQGLVLHRAGQIGPDDVLGRVTLDRQERPTLSAIARKKRVLVALAPTALPYGIARATCPSGLWTVTVSARMAQTDDRIEAWIQRDDTPIGYTRAGRPSYFDDPAYVRFQSPSGDVATQDLGPSVVKRAGAISGIVTGQTSTIVGGYVGDPAEAQASLYAGRTNGGKALDINADPPSIRAPGQAAQADRSRVLQGLRAAGTRSGSTVTMNGTSIAAPQWTRRIAETWMALPQPPLVPITPPHPQLGIAALPAPGDAPRFAAGLPDPAQGAVLA